MATIIDNTYFEKGSLYIPNNKDINVAPVDTPSSQSELDFFIEKYERELLLNAFGVTLYNELQSQIPNPTIQKWIDLINGSDYTDADGEVKRWDGLKGNLSQSVIAFFVYCEYLRNDNEAYATVGTVKNNAKNADNVDATPKYIKAWHQFIDFYQGQNYCTPQVIVNRSGMIGLDYYGEGNKVQVSLYQYLMDANTLDDTSFPDFDNYFKFYRTKNSFGI